MRGLIKIPIDLYKSMLKYIYTQYISYINLYDSYIASELSERYKVKIDTYFHPDNKYVELNTTLEGLPEKIKNNWKLEFGYLRLIIDWEQNIWKDRPKVNASYEESDTHGIPGYFTINPRKLMELVSSDASIQDYIEIFNKLATSVYHEVTHAVQHNSLKWLDRNQVGKSRIIRDDPTSPKEAKRREYLTSQVEFDPTIKTKITQFQKKYKGKDLIKYLPIFVGAIKVNGEEPDEFFNALKLTDIKRWKRAVKKLYLNYDLDIEHILNNIPNS